MTFENKSLKMVRPENEKGQYVTRNGQVTSREMDKLRHEKWTSCVMRNGQVVIHNQYLVV